MSADFPGNSTHHAIGRLRSTGSLTTAADSGHDSQGSLSRTLPTMAFWAELAMFLVFVAMSIFYSTVNRRQPATVFPADHIHESVSRGATQAMMSFMASENVHAGIAEARECLVVGSFTTLLEEWKLVRTVFIETTIHYNALDDVAWRSFLSHNFKLSESRAISIPISCRKLII